MDIMLKLTLVPEQAKVIADALSMSIIDLDKTKSHITLGNHVQVYVFLKNILDKKYPDWLQSNDEVKAILKRLGY